MVEALQYEFMRNALLAGLLAAVACGIVGVYVVVKKIVFISGGIAHASFGGIGLGYFLGINPVLGAVFFSLASALGMGLVTKRTRLPQDTAIGILWAIGMALGIIFIGLTPGYAPDLFGYLFGSILTVPAFDLLQKILTTNNSASFPYLQRVFRVFVQPPPDKLPVLQPPFSIVSPKVFQYHLMINKRFSFPYM